VYTRVRPVHSVLTRNLAIASRSRVSSEQQEIFRRRVIEGGRIACDTGRGGRRRKHIFKHGNDGIVLHGEETFVTPLATTA